MTGKRVARRINDYDDMSVDVHKRDENGRTLMHHSAYETNITLTDYLILQGGDVNATDAEGRTPIHLAALSGDFAGVVQLYNAGASNIDVMDNRNRTPLHMAAISGDNGLINYLINVGADITLKDADGKLPVDLATLDHVKNFFQQDIFRREFLVEQERQHQILKEQERLEREEKELKRKERKRKPRSLPSVSSLKSAELAEPGLKSILGKGLQKMIHAGDPSSFSSRNLLREQAQFGTNPVNHLLTLAFSYAAAKNSHRLTRSRFALTPPEILANRMDKVALEAIDNYFSSD